MKNAHDRAKLTLALIPLTALALGMLSPFLTFKHAMDYLLLAFFGLSQNFLIFLWYRLDADERGFQRSRWRNTGVVAVTALAIPYYLVRTRGFGRGLLVTGLFFMLFLASSLAMILGTATGLYLVPRNHRGPLPPRVTITAPAALQAPTAVAESGSLARWLFSKRQEEYADELQG